MLLPLYDDNADRHILPVITYALITANVIVFALLQRFGTDEDFTNAYATVPREIITGNDQVTRTERKVKDPLLENRVELPELKPTPPTVYITLITSMFMHGGIIHLVGNMLFLWIFGDNVENDLGHWRFSLFYLICGVLASLAYVFTTAAFSGLHSEQMLIPCLGASGAIAGVIGAYMLLHPKREVTVLFFRRMQQMPARNVIGIWIAFQILGGVIATAKSEPGGGVAYSAHIGGFLVGLALARPLASLQRAQAARREAADLATLKQALKDVDG